MQFSERLKNLPPYLFARIDELKAKKIAEGVDIISLGIGDPDLPTPKHIVQAMKKAVADAKNHQYPSYEGCREFREAVAYWYHKNYNVQLDAKTEIISLIGAKEALAHLPLAFVNDKDIVLVPDPGYPVYAIATQLAGGQPISMPLLKKNYFLPDLSEIDTDVARKAKLMFLNYPNMPTSAVASKHFFEDVIEFAKNYDIVICHDFPYSEIVYDNYKAISILQIKDGKDVAVEIHSLSKTYNMTGWRVGYAVGNKDIVQALLNVKTNVDSGVFQAIQYAAIAALKGPQNCIAEVCEVYKKRRDKVVDCFNSLGWNLTKPLATLYIWIEVPEGKTSAEFATEILDKTGVLVVPGTGYGKWGEGYVRISLTVADKRLDEALKRIKESGIKFK